MEKKASDIVIIDLEIKLYFSLKLESSRRYHLMIKGDDRADT